MTPHLSQRIARLLRSDEAVSNLVADRIYPAKADQGAEWPHLVYLVASSDPRPTLGGNTSNLNHVRLQVDCYDKDYEVARDLARAVVAAIGSLETSEMRSVTLDEGRDLYEDKLELYRVLCEFSIWAKETT